MRDIESPSCQYGSPQLDALVERVHRDLRRERQARALRQETVPRGRRRKRILLSMTATFCMLAALFGYESYSNAHVPSAHAPPRISSTAKP